MPAFFRQFGNPKGPLGWCVGHLMALKNGARSRFALELLAAAPGEGVLELGFGPGVDIARLLVAVRPGGGVTGLDVSREMWRHARRRNRRGVAEGSADLRLGTATALPFADASFDAVYSTNSAQFWDDLALGLREVKRVLRPSGRAVIVVQPMARGATRDDSLAWGARLVSAAKATGFSRIDLAERELGPRLAVALVAQNA